MRFTSFWCKLWDKYWYYQKLELISVILSFFAKLQLLSNGCYGPLYFNVQNEISFGLFQLPPHFCVERLYFLRRLGNWLIWSIESPAGYILVFLKLVLKMPKIGKNAENCNLESHYLIKKIIACRQFDFSEYPGCYINGLPGHSFSL